MLDAVCDSGPLIHLNEIGQISLLDVLRKLTVPNSVASETSRLNLKNLTIVKVSKKELASFVNQIKNFKLQKAETDALYLANKFGCMLLTDDLEARNAAVKLNMEVQEKSYNIRNKADLWKAISPKR